MKILGKIFKWFGILFGLGLLLFIVLLIIPERENVKAIKARSNTEYWIMNEGFRIAYTHLTPQSKSSYPTVIYLHGGPGGYVHSSIINTLEELTDHGYEVFLYDQRGSGLSDRMPKFSDINFDKHLNDLYEIINEKIKTRKVILLGQSFGSVLAAHFSAYHPELVENIIFCSPGSLLPAKKINNTYADLAELYPQPDSLDFIEPYNFVKDVDNMAMKPKAIIATLGALLFDLKLISDNQMDRMLNTLASQFTKGMVCEVENVLPEEGGGGLYAYLATNNGDMPDVREKLNLSEIPVMVMQGQCEYHPFGSAYEYVDLYPKSKYVFVKNAGHEICWEQEEVFIDEILRFLN